MSKAEWGMKRICPSCGMRYYDMKKKPPSCPKCKTVFDPENLLRARRGRTADKKAAVKDIA
ncbi:MAG: TIGR02300 family protein, partial [Alphaproteobacteria bacterium]